ncbi:MAG: glycosyltransferase family 39 protein, partial [Bifidobacteriaceae bacterium]|nr:glycosyltransferase family 39 protein [Bifidobacteriaceae bacterium]
MTSAQNPTEIGGMPVASGHGPRRRDKRLMLREARIDRALLLGLLAALAFTCALNIDLPGLYMDAVNPDYLVARVFVHNDYPAWYLTSIGPPLLIQMHHGAITTLFQIPFYAVLGGSVVTVRLLNWCYLAVCLVFIYKLIRLSGRARESLALSRSTAVLVGLAFVFSIGVVMSTRTQLYIMLPGAAMILASVYVCEKPGGRGGARLLVSGLLAGLALYDYFVFVMFVPALACMVLTSPRYTPRPRAAAARTGPDRAARAGKGRGGRPAGRPLGRRRGGAPAG